MIKIASTTAFLLAAVCTSTASAADAGAKVDLTPVFAGMEKDCASNNKKYDAVFEFLSTESGKAPAVAKAGPELRAAIGAGRVKVKNEGDHWVLTVPVTNATYRGAPVVGIERLKGKDNGIVAISLMFASPPAVVEKSIGKIKPATGEEEQTMPQLYPEKGTSRAVLMCDYST